MKYLIQETGLVRLKSLALLALLASAFMGSTVAVNAATLQYSGNVNLGWFPPAAITVDFGDTIQFNNVSTSNYTMNVDSASTSLPAPSVAETFTVNIAKGASFSFLIDNPATFVFSTRFQSVSNGSVTSTRFSTVSVNPASLPAVPLPASFPLFGAALAGLGLVMRRRKAAA